MPDGLPRHLGLDPAGKAVAELYEDAAVGLIRLAHVILADRPAEDVVQEAFYNLYRRWNRLSDPDRAQQYLRTSVLNGCRPVLRSRAVRSRKVLYDLPSASAEAAVLGRAERDEVIRAVDQLPRRQREVLVLRFYLNLHDDEIARLMGVGLSTVRSNAHRALESLGRMLKEES